MIEKRPWWQDTVVYQIYPRSFQDSDGDGVGDLRGIAERADYLVRLGIGTVWISPIYPSPMADFGYDVADYCGIDPLFGSLGDLDALVGDAPRQGSRADPRSRAEPQLERPSLVPGIPVLTEERRGATGTSGGIRRRTAGRPTTG